MSFLLPSYSSALDLTNGNRAVFRGLSNNYSYLANLVDVGTLRVPNFRIYLKFMTGTTVRVGGSLDIWVATSLDGSNFTDGFSAANFVGTVISAVQPKNSWLVGSIPVSAVSTSYYFEDDLLNLTASLPKYMGIICYNQTGGALNSTDLPLLQGCSITHEYA